MIPESVRIIRADRPEPLLALAASCGWNQTLHDCRELTNTQDAICFYAETDGEIIGSAAAKLYGENHTAFINMVVVREAWRGRKIATSMLKKLMQTLAGFRTFRLYATPAGSHVYAKLGFKTYIEMTKYIKADHHPRMPEGIQPLAEKDLAGIIALDARSFGVKREKILRYFYTQAPQFSFKCSDRNGRITGFTIGRDGPVSRAAAALTAASEQDAIRLFNAVAAAGDPAPKTHLIIPDTHTEMIRIALANGIQPSSSKLVCMEYGQPGPLPAAHYFSVLGGDFG